MYTTTRKHPEMTQGEIDEFLAIRREAGKAIDPETAEVWWMFAYTLDPYDLGLDLPKEEQQVGREYFARVPGSDIWVLFDDLPVATGKTLWTRYKHELTFPF
jgi:hypothetical protein